MPLPPTIRSSRLLDRWLGGEAPDELDREARCTAITRFQQLSAPLAAKAVEDTAFYRHGVLLSRNEVGADIARLRYLGRGIPRTMPGAARQLSRCDAGHRDA